MSVRTHTKMTTCAPHLGRCRHCRAVMWTGAWPGAGHHPPAAHHPPPLLPPPWPRPPHRQWGRAGWWLWWWVVEGRGWRGGMRAGWRCPSLTPSAGCRGMTGARICTCSSGQRQRMLPASTHPATSSDISKGDVQDRHTPTSMEQQTTSIYVRMCTET